MADYRNYCEAVAEASVEELERKINMLAKRGYVLHTSYVVNRDDDGIVPDGRTYHYVALMILKGAN